METQTPTQTACSQPAACKPCVRKLTPAFDIVQSPERVDLWVDLPGVTQEGLSLEVEDRVLKLKARRKLPAHEGYRLNGKSAQVSEFEYTRFFQLGQDLDEDGIQANLKDGLLRISLPLQEHVKPKKIVVQS